MMIKESIMKDQEAEERQAIDQMDSDANLPNTSDSEDEGSDGKLGIKA